MVQSAAAAIVAGPRPLPVSACEASVSGGQQAHGLSVARGVPGAEHGLAIHRYRPPPTVPKADQISPKSPISGTALLSCPPCTAASCIRFAD